MGFWGLRIAFAVTAAVSAWLTAGDARAANGAFAVDAADISEVGSCKVESWISTATNSDFSAVANPSCVANIFKPVELSLLTNRSRSDGDWSTSEVEYRSHRNRKTRIFILCGRLVRCADRRKSHGLRGGACDLQAVRNHADQRQCRLAVGPHGRPALPDLWPWLRLEIHRCIAADAGSIRPGRRIGYPKCGSAAVSGRRALPAQRDFLGRSNLRPQHYRRERQLDHGRDHDPVSGAGSQAGK